MQANFLEIKRDKFYYFAWMVFAFNANDSESDILLIDLSIKINTD